MEGRRQEGEERGIMRGIPSGSVRIVADDGAECDRGAAAFFAFFDRKSRTRDLRPRPASASLPHTHTQVHIVTSSVRTIKNLFVFSKNF